MSSNLGSCSFHPDRSASTSCTRCHRLLCSEDTKVLKSNKRSLKGNQYFCPICYVSAFKDFFKFAWFSLVLTIIFLPVSIYYYTMHNLIPTVGFGLISLLPVAFFIVSYVKIGPEYSRAKKETNNFLNSLNDISVLFTSSEGASKPPVFYQERNFNSNAVKHLVCFQCGRDLSKSPRYCPNCSGMRTDEDEFLRRRKIREGGL